jgi:hypothetical protein
MEVQFMKNILTWIAQLCFTNSMTGSITQIKKSDKSALIV